MFNFVVFRSLCYGMSVFLIWLSLLPSCPSTVRTSDLCGVFSCLTAATMHCHWL